MTRTTHKTEESGWSTVGKPPEDFPWKARLEYLPTPTAAGSYIPEEERWKHLIFGGMTVEPARTEPGAILNLIIAIVNRTLTTSTEAARDKQVLRRLQLIRSVKELRSWEGIRVATNHESSTIDYGPSEATTLATDILQALAVEWLDEYPHRLPESFKHVFFEQFKTRFLAGLPPKPEVEIKEPPFKARYEFWDAERAYPGWREISFGGMVHSKGYSPEDAALNLVKDTLHKFLDTNPDAADRQLLKRFNVLNIRHTTTPARIATSLYSDSGYTEAKPATQALLETFDEFRDEIEAARARARPSDPLDRVVFIPSFRLHFFETFKAKLTATGKLDLNLAELLLPDFL